MMPCNQLPWKLCKMAVSKASVGRHTCAERHYPLVLPFPLTPSSPPTPSYLFLLSPTLLSSSYLFLPVLLSSSPHRDTPGPLSPLHYTIIEEPQWKPSAPLPTTTKFVVFCQAKIFRSSSTHTLPCVACSLPCCCCLCPMVFFPIPVSIPV